MGAVDFSVFAGDERIGGGAYRTVYGYDSESVIKIDKYEGNRSANLRELERWTVERSTPNRQYLAEILEATDGPSPWLRMERVCGTLSNYVWAKFGNGKQPSHTYDFPSCPNHEKDDDNCDGSWFWFKELPELRSLLDAAKNMGLYDMHPWNIGVRADGTFVIIDYAD